MARSKADYDSVFEGRSRRERSQRSATVGLSAPQRGGQPSAPFADAESVVAFVEEQVRTITAAIRLALPLPADPDDIQRPCALCVSGAEPHLHGAKLFERGKELY